MSSEQELDPTNKYTKMQKTQYEADASRWNIHNLDPVVGSFRAHNDWSDYSFLFKDIDELKTKSVLQIKKSGRKGQIFMRLYSQCIILQVLPL